MKALVALILLASAPAIAQGVSIISNPEAPPAAAAQAPAQWPFPQQGAPTQQAPVDPELAAQDPSLQVTADQAEYQQKIQAINAHNPMSADFGAGAPVPGAGDNPSEQGGPSPQLVKMLENPMVQRYIRAFRTPAAAQMASNAKTVFEHPNKMTLLYAEIALLVVMFLLRAWRNGRARSFVQRIWVSVSSTALTVALGSIALPYLIIGPQYVNVLRNLYEMWSQSA